MDSLASEDWGDRMTGDAFDSGSIGTKQFDAVSVGAGWVAGAVVQRSGDWRLLHAR